MTRLEFARILAYIAAAIGKPLTQEAAEVYHDLLGDLPADVMQTAAKRVVLEHKWATFPTVAELRQAAAETMHGQVTEISPAEAWSMAWHAAGRIDLEQPGSAERHLSRLPPIVAEAVAAFGLPALIYGREPVGVVRAQFVKIFEQLAARDRRRALLPRSLTQAIVSRAALPVPIGEAIARIGVQP